MRWSLAIPMLLAAAIVLLFQQQVAQLTGASQAHLAPIAAFTLASLLLFSVLRGVDRLAPPKPGMQDWHGWLALALAGLAALYWFNRAEIAAVLGWTERSSNISALMLGIIVCVWVIRRIGPEREST